MPERKPIGYWLKELDRRIEETLDRTLASEGVTRRDWQVLNALDVAPAARDAVVDALRPFWGEGAADPDDVLEALVARGWALRDADSRYALSPEGDATRADAARAREGAADGDRRRRHARDYQTTIDTLERMAANLTALDAAPGELDLGRGRHRADRLS